MDQNQKRIVWLFPAMIFGVSAFALLIRFFSGKSFTLLLVLYDFLFSAIFTFVIISLALLFDYFFGKKVRKNPRPIFLMNAIIFFIIAAGNVYKIVRDYMAAKGFDWVVLVLPLFFFWGSFHFFYLAKRVRRKK